MQVPILSKPSTRPTCFGCGVELATAGDDLPLCGKTRCRRHAENERRRTILSAIVSTLEEAKGRGGEVGSFATELLATLKTVGINVPARVPPDPTR